jgi:hypothetical protein
MNILKKKSKYNTSHRKIKNISLNPILQKKGFTFLKLISCLLVKRLKKYLLFL